MKTVNWPLGRVTQVFEYSIGEITHAIVKKGRTSELTKRHVTCLVYLFSPETSISPISKDTNADPNCQPDIPPEIATRPKRAAAVRSTARIKSMIEDNAL